ncbi:MAG: hypothetical protein II126_04165 [Erysipelotrichaceae bacterium]|nr:hypothetical protein [Erysipelotrichaceae bacterium]
MRVGFNRICINPAFPVKAMTLREKTMECADELYARVLVIEPDQGKPFYHISIDVVEIWQAYRDQIKQLVEKTVGKEVDMVVSATHAHVTPFCTTDEAWREYLNGKIEQCVRELKMKSYEKLEYSYNYHYFDKLGKSREAELKHVALHLYAETLSFYGDGKRIGTILIHNSHPTIKSLREPPLTADYPGYCMKKMSERHPDEFFTFLLGPAGDVSPHFVRANQQYSEIAVLGDRLIEEFERQLDEQKNIRPVDKFRYREVILPIERGPREPSNAVIPPQEKITEQERKIIERSLLPHENMNRKYQNRELDPMEIIDEYIISQLILSEDYSIVFEPAEMYSEFYGSVNKQTTTLATISNGFDHYITGLYLNHVTAHSFPKYGFTDRMRRNLWETFTKMSLQFEDDELN